MSPPKLQEKEKENSSSSEGDPNGLTSIFDRQVSLGLSDYNALWKEDTARLLCIVHCTVHTALHTVQFGPVTFGRMDGKT